MIEYLFFYLFLHSHVVNLEDDIFLLYKDLSILLLVGNHTTKKMSSSDQTFTDQPKLVSDSTI